MVIRVYLVNKSAQSLGFVSDDISDCQKVKLLCLPQALSVVSGLMMPFVLPPTTLLAVRGMSHAP